MEISDEEISVSDSDPIGNKKTLLLEISHMSK